MWSRAKTTVVAREPFRRVLARLVVPAWLFLAVASGLLALQQGAVTNSDGHSMLETSRSLVTSHGLTVPQDDGVQGRDGRYFSKYGIGLPVVVAPAVASAEIVGAIAGHQDEIVSFAAASIVPIVAALTAVAIFSLARTIGGSSRSSALVAVGAIVGTYYLPYSKDFFSEPLAALLIVVGIDLTLRRKLPLAGAAIGFAVLTRPQSAIVLVLWVLCVVALQRRRALLGVAIAMAAVPIQLLLNWIRFGSLADGGYHGEGFTTAPWDGARTLLWSSQKSVLIFAPIIIVAVPALWALRKRQPTAPLLIGGNLLVTFALNATWHSVEGGWSWGPRLLLPGVMPALAPIAAWMDTTKMRRHFVACLLVVGFAVSASTLIVPTQAQQLDSSSVKVGPSILRQYELIPRTLRYTRAHLFDRGATGTGVHRSYVNLWQVNVARTAGRAALAGALLLTLALVGGAAVSSRRLLRLLVGNDCGEAPLTSSA